MRTLDRLKELEAKATPGPWLLATSNGGFIVEFDGNYVLDAFVSDVLAQDKQRANAKLIAEMRNALPKLLAVVEAGNLLELRSKRIGELLKALGHEGEALRLEKARSAYSNATAEL